MVIGPFFDEVRVFRGHRLVYIIVVALVDNAAGDLMQRINYLTLKG